MSDRDATFGASRNSGGSGSFQRVTRCGCFGPRKFSSQAASKSRLTRLTLLTAAQQPSAEGGVVKSPGSSEYDRAPAPHFSPRNSEKHFFVCLGADDCTCMSRAQRRASLATGGGGVKISTTFRATTAWALTRGFFFRGGRFDYSNRNQTKSNAVCSARKSLRAHGVSKWRASPARRRVAKSSNYFRRAPHATQPLRKIVAKFGVGGGSSDAEGLR